MSRRSERLAGATLTAAFIFGLAACGDSTGPESNLSQEQAQKVAQAVSQQTYTSIGETGGATMLPSAEDGTLSANISAATTVEMSFSRNCPGGGSVSWSGEAVQNDEQTETTIDASLEYTECTTTVEQSTVTITSADAFTYSATLLRPSDTEIQWSSDLTGSVEWTVDDESGNSCSIGLQTDITATGVGVPGEGSIDATTTGQVCGHDVERTFNLEASS